jgi:inhibitor of KinA sporulation pathway (predicted exonuclease)
MEMCFQLLAFGTIQFLDLLKANKKMIKSYKQTPKLTSFCRTLFSSCSDFSYDNAAFLSIRAENFAWMQLIL